MGNIKEVIDKKKVKKAILKVWGEIPQAFFDENKDWYWKCNEWCQELADEKKVPLMCVVGIFASLSPQASFKHNKNICRLYFEGINKHTGANISKCDKIALLYGIDMYEARKQQILNILNGSKTQNFFINILEPSGDQACTIDRHALVIAGISRPTVTAKQYEIIKEGYVEVAKELGILPLELQAVTWTWHRLQKFGHHKYD